VRIVSLVPSLTHMVCDFGLRDSLVGCTSFCVKPAGLQRSAVLVGGTKDPDLRVIRELEPTHILVNEEENKPEHIAACRAICDTMLTYPKDPREVPAMLRASGRFLGVEALGEALARQLEAALARPAPARKRRFIYYIWREPYMVVGPDTYISRLLELGGYQNAVPPGERYPTLTVEQAAALAPECLLLSSEPYPFRRRDAERLRGEWPGRAPEMLKIDGQLLSWYGTLTIEAVEALDGLAHPFDGQALPSQR
jgi:ABC-type hemin transport system substrate-binding protein